MLARRQPNAGGSTEITTRTPPFVPLHGVGRLTPDPLKVLRPPQDSALTAALGQHRTCKGRRKWQNVFVVVHPAANAAAAGPPLPALNGLGNIDAFT